MGENDTTNGVEEKKDNIQVISEKGNDKDNNNDSTNEDNNMSFLKKMKQMKIFSCKIEKLIKNQLIMRLQIHLNN